MRSIRINPVVRLASRLLLGCKAIFLRRRIRHPRLERVRDRYFLILPEVLHPVVFRSGAYFADCIADTGIAKPIVDKPDPVALDMGTGSGICAVFAAALGYQVIGIDINPYAARCAEINVLLNRLEDRIEIRQGDLFNPVSGLTFDLILFNPPFYHAAPESAFEMAWKSLDVSTRFAAGLASALKQDGKALVLLSTDGDADVMLAALGESGLTVKTVQQKHFGNEIMTIHECRRPGTGDR